MVFLVASFLTFLLISVALHTLGHFLVAGLVALLGYEKLGLRILQKAWFNTFRMKQASYPPECWIKKWF